MQITENKKQKQKFDGVLLSGLISGIAISSIVMLACIGSIIWSIWIIATGTKLEKIAVELLVFFIILFFIGMIGQFVNLRFTTRFLKGKYDNKKTVAFWNLYAIGIIAIGVIIFILILIGTEQQDNTQNFSTHHVEQVDLEFQEYLQYKKQNKITR